MLDCPVICVFNKYKEKQFVPAWLFSCIIVFFIVLFSLLDFGTPVSEVALSPPAFHFFCIEREDRRSDLELDFVSPFALSFVLILRCHQK